jgi:hypothetical protein
MFAKQCHERVLVPLASEAAQQLVIGLALLIGKGCQVADLPKQRAG